MSALRLLRTKRFAPFFWTQFAGAFNDNVFKNAVALLFAFRAVDSARADALVNLAAGLFILPFFLFSATAGQLADKYDKARIMRIVKACEIPIMGVGAVGFVLESMPLLLAVVFLMGLQSTFFGPSKYSILPQHLAPAELVGGNGLVESGTFLAILFGTLVAGVLLSLGEGGVTAVSLMVCGVACIGYLISRGIPLAPPGHPSLRIDWNPIRATRATLRAAAEQRSVLYSVLGISWFWFYGAFFLAQLPGFARDALGGDEAVVTVLLVAFSIGIGVGSMLCERLSGAQVELGLVPLGALGLTVFAVDVFFALPSSPDPALRPLWFFTPWTHNFAYARIFLDLMAIGVFGGWFIVPLYALVQQRSRLEVRSRVIAAANIWNACFMVASALFAITLRLAGLKIPQMFLVVAGLNVLVTLYIFRLIPEFAARFLSWLIVRSMYRLRVQGQEHIPKEGAALLAPNHVSFVDALLVFAASPRPVRFVMDHRIYASPLLHMIFRGVGAIPIASRRDDPALLDKAFDAIAVALEEGELVVIFPEGGITRTGALQPFKPGILSVLARTPVPVIPVGLSGLWGSYFSRIEGRAMSKPFRRGVRTKVGVRFAAAVPPEAVQLSALEASVRSLCSDPPA